MEAKNIEGVRARIEDINKALGRMNRPLEQQNAYLAALNFIYALRQFGYDYNTTRELVILAGILFEEGRL